MKAYVPYHPTHPGTYAFRVAQGFALFLCLLALLGCASSRKTETIQEEHRTEEHLERVTAGQSLISFFDSLTAVVRLEADSLQLEVFDVGRADIGIDSLAATRPQREQAPLRLAARLKVSGIRSNTQMSRAQAACAESLSMDTASRHRFDHHSLSESLNEEKAVKPPGTFWHLAVLVMAIAILLGVLLLAAVRLKR